MSSILQRHASNQHVQLGIAALAGGVVTASLLIGYQSLKRQERANALKRSIPALLEDMEDGRHVELTEYGFANTKSLTNDEASRSEDESAARIAERARKGEYAEELINEQLTRTSSFLTPDCLLKVRRSFVIVLGLGGVGSHAVAALARSGVSHIRLVDFDQVTLSSLNRHALATLSDVGTPKVHCVRRRLEQIVPWVHFDCRNELYSSDAASTLLQPWSVDTTSTSSVGDDFVGRKPDYVVDCIDNISSKVDLLHYCHNHSIPVISSMGAGCKSDPTRISIDDISASAEDPLSRATRRRLKLLGVHSGIPVVFSTEKPGPGKASLLPLPEEEFSKGSVGDLGVLPDFRVRILPVLGSMPAVFGYSLASYVLCKIAGYPLDFIAGQRGRDKMYDAMLASLQGSEERLARWQEKKRQYAEADSNPMTTTSQEEGQKRQTQDPAIGLRLPITKEDVAYLTEEVYRGKSVISNLSTRLTLVRWQRPPPPAHALPFSTASSSAASTWNVGFGPDPQHLPSQKVVTSILPLSNLVAMTKEEAGFHESEVLMGGKKVEDVYPPAVLERVGGRRREEEWFERFR